MDRASQDLSDIPVPWLISKIQSIPTWMPNKGKWLPADKNEDDGYSILNINTIGIGSVGNKHSSLDNKSDTLNWISFEHDSPVPPHRGIDMPSESELAFKDDDTCAKRSRMWNQNENMPEIDGGGIVDGSLLTSHTALHSRKTMGSHLETAERKERNEEEEYSMSKDVGIPTNISRQRYEEHMKKEEMLGAMKEETTVSVTVSKGEPRRPEPGRREELIKYLEDTINMHVKKEEGMRLVIKTQENSLRIKDGEILLLQQKIQTLLASMEIEGKNYIEECVGRGEKLVTMLEKEVNEERETLKRRLNEEVENSRILSKKVDDLKKVINELVRKVKKTASTTPGI